MPEEQTTIITKSDTGNTPVNGSSIWGVSVRAWVVLLIVFSVCGNWVLNTILVSLGYTSGNITVPEPIYSVFIAVISYYFGQVKKN